MTKDELKKILKSKENLLAKKAIEIIKKAGSIQELQKLLDQGCPDKYYQRDPQHPRSRYRINHVLDFCFESNFGIVEKTSNQNQRTTRIILGDVHQSSGRLEHFKLLLENNFQRGSNGWRGDLFEHILNCCFYACREDNSMEKARQSQAKEFAKTLCEKGSVNINTYAARSYTWVSNPKNLSVLEYLGANLKSSTLIDCALNYIGCSPNSGETPTGRIEVVQALLNYGAKPTINLNKTVGWHNIRKKLKESQLFDTMVNYGLIESQDNADYLRWLRFETQGRI